DFRDGVALVEDLHPERYAALELHGYTVEVIADPIDVEAMTVAQLKTLAAELGIDVPKGAKRADLIEALAPKTLAAGGVVPMAGDAIPDDQSGLPDYIFPLTPDEE